MADIVLLDANGTSATYQNVDSITVPISGGGTATFTTGGGGTKPAYLLNNGDIVTTLYFNVDYNVGAILPYLTYDQTETITGAGLSYCYLGIGHLSAFDLTNLGLSGEYAVAWADGTSGTVVPIYATTAVPVFGVTESGWQVASYTPSSSITVDYTYINPSFFTVMDEIVAQDDIAFGEHGGGGGGETVSGSVLYTLSGKAASMYYSGAFSGSSAKLVLKIPSEATVKYVAFLASFRSTNIDTGVTLSSWRSSATYPFTSYIDGSWQCFEATSMMGTHGLSAGIAIAGGVDFFMPAVSIRAVTDPFVCLETPETNPAVEISVYTGNDSSFEYGQGTIAALRCSGNFSDADRMKTSGFQAIHFETAESINGILFSARQLRYIEAPVATRITFGALKGQRNLITASFRGCTGIENNAFYNCNALESLYMLTPTVPTLSSTNIFTYSPMSSSGYLGRFGSIYVLPSMVEAFKAASYWSAYSARITAYTE